MKATLIASWDRNCFCERPRLAVEELTTDYHPRFEFKATARRLAAFNGLTQLAFNRIDRRATAKGPFFCQHNLSGAPVSIECSLR